MTGYEELISRVRERAGVDSNESAERAARAAVETVTGYLPAAETQLLVDALPRRLRDAARQEQDDSEADAADLVDDLARRLEENPERARYLLQGVLSALHDDQPGVVDRLRQSLPGALGEPAGTPVATAEPISSRRLTDGEVEQELGALPAWTGDSRRIRRTVSVPPDRRDMLIDQVMRSADEEKERLEVEGTEDGLTLTVYTASVDAVTPSDLSFAARLDGIIDAAPYISR